MMTQTAQTFCIWITPHGRPLWCAKSQIACITMKPAPRFSLPVRRGKFLCGRQLSLYDFAGSEKENTLPALYRIDLNGQNRTQLATLPSEFDYNNPLPQMVKSCTPCATE